MLESVEHKIRYLYCTLTVKVRKDDVFGKSWLVGGGREDWREMRGAREVHNFKLGELLPQLSMQVVRSSPNQTKP